MTRALPMGYAIRAPHSEDLPAIVDLLQTCERADIGEPQTTLDATRARWETPDGALATNGWLALAPDGAPVGFAAVMLNATAPSVATIRVHPDHRGQGLGRCLLQRLEARARDYLATLDPGATITMHGWAPAEREATMRLLEPAGYARVRRFWDMLIELREPPPAASWPEGIQRLPFVPERDAHAVFAASREAFRDHWGGMTYTFERWRRTFLEVASFDPGLWFIARAGDEVAGVAACVSRGATGWVNELSVRRPWRGRGLAAALLREAFGEFYRRGHRRIALGVDSENPTGAVRVYERAGMSVWRAMDTYEKIMSR